jgi:hypothetical protein
MLLGWLASYLVGTCKNDAQYACHGILIRRGSTPASTASFQQRLRFQTGHSHVMVGMVLGALVVYSVGFD